MTKPLQVMKFGGTSVGDATCIARSAQIVASAAKGMRVVVVVSAMSGVTNRLIDAAKRAEKAIQGPAARSLRLCASSIKPRLQSLLPTKAHAQMLNTGWRKCSPRANGFTTGPQCFANSHHARWT